MKRNVRTGIFAACFAILLLGGCAGKTETGSESPGTIVAEESSWDWKADGFAAQGTLAEGEKWYPSTYVSWRKEISASDLGDGWTEISSGVCENLLWLFEQEIDSEGIIVRGESGRYALSLYDPSSGEWSRREFTPSELGAEGEDGFFVDLRLADPGHFALRWCDYAQDEDGMYTQTTDRIFYTDLAGEIRNVDYLDILLERGVYSVRSTILPSITVLHWGLGGEGMLYVTSSSEDGNAVCFLFDENGTEKLRYERGQTQRIADPFRMGDGELILPVAEEGACTFYWMDAEAGEMRAMGTVGGESPIDRIYGAWGTNLYYRTSGYDGASIVQWNLQSGEQKELLNLADAGVSTEYETLLAVDAKERIFLELIRRGEERTEEWVAELGRDPQLGQGVIRVAGIADSDRVRESVALASMSNPNFQFSYEDASEDDARTRLMAELSSGEGPELLFVPMEDFAVLNEKGLLGDLGGVIPEDLREELLPGALEAGTVDGCLRGIPASVRAETLVVSSAVWEGETWQLEDIIRLMDEGSLTGALVSSLGERYLDPSATMLYLLSYSLEDSFLIDWEAGESHFEDERFLRLLERTAEDLSGIDRETEAFFGGGADARLALLLKLSDFIELFQGVRAEEGNLVGFPTGGACGSYLIPVEGLLVMRAGAREDAAAAFLEVLLGEEIQSRSSGGFGLSVRKIMPADYLVSDETGALHYMDAKHGVTVPVFDDGTTALDRAGVFLENCHAAPDSYAPIREILIEELGSLYYEGKSAQEVAGILDKRVGLYLEEHR